MHEFSVFCQRRFIIITTIKLHVKPFHEPFKAEPLRTVAPDLILSTDCTYALRMGLTINSLYLCKRHYRNDLCNRGCVFSVRYELELVGIYNLDRFIV